MNRWITDPEVDSRLSGRVFLPLVSDSHLLFVACGVHDLDFLGDDFRNYSRIQRYLGRQWIHVGFSLRGVLPSIVGRRRPFRSAEADPHGPAS